MTIRTRSFAAVAVLGLALAGCGDSKSDNAPLAPVPGPVATAQSKFGTCFQTRFDAAPDTKATDPVPCPDLPPLSLTTKPNAL